MPNIQVLDPHVADLIAAGEVVERPASVAKELMENAIDAGASAVTVEIAHGGMTFLRVTDDGCGIPASELKTAFLRHATSKLRTEYDLEAIGTLGFRGEALAAISAVSRVEVMTRTQDSPLGASLSLEGGVPGEVEEAGCPLGTTMVVRDLFYNTPARMKFMKSDATESSHVFAAVQRQAVKGVLRGVVLRRVPLDVQPLAVGHIRPDDVRRAKQLDRVAAVGIGKQQGGNRASRFRAVEQQPAVGQRIGQCGGALPQPCGAGVAVVGAVGAGAQVGLHPCGIVHKHHIGGAVRGIPHGIKAVLVPVAAVYARAGQRAVQRKRLDGRFRRGCLRRLCVRCGGGGRRRPAGDAAASRQREQKGEGQNGTG